MNTDQDIKNLIQNHMKKLPLDVQEAIHGSSWERKILDIGRKYGLHVDQLEILQTELSLAVLGLTERDEFVRETMREAHIDKHIMETMVADINREIFEPIREHLRKTRQQAYEIERETLSGSNSDVDVEKLHQDEEETLEKHGISLDLGKEQVVYKPQPIPQEQQETPKQNPTPVLEKPIRLSTQQEGAKTTISFSDILKETPVVPSQQETQETQKTVSPNPFEMEIDPNVLPSKSTEENQKTIQDTRKPFYEKSDPYREPIV